MFGGGEALRLNIVYVFAESVVKRLVKVGVLANEFRGEAVE